MSDWRKITSSDQSEFRISTALFYNSFKLKLAYVFSPQNIYSFVKLINNHKFQIKSDQLSSFYTILMSFILINFSNLTQDIQRSFVSMNVIKPIFFSCHPCPWIFLVFFLRIMTPTPDSLVDLFIYLFIQSVLFSHHYPCRLNESSWVYVSPL